LEAIVIETTIAQPAQPTTTRRETRADRALALYGAHAETIALSFHRGVYKVPSCSGSAVYTVRLVPTPRCSCRDAPGGECKHVATVRVVRKATVPCAGCGRRFFHRELVEAGDGHLTFFEGDVVCGPCAWDHGVA
jgi:hypothetical protein